MREIITLECTVCKNRNYTTTKNKKTHQDKLEVKKFCKFCSKHTLHKEIK
ncbi:MAG: 50S ribosomal protein L33 [Candidatus Omnitrophica bacterium CG23_combo_of_CG06-09_8_20_14_all_40_11]|nr:MAG: 50S ribosomal protein L33 [Candidatus Omnitrophica bacterium CG23_combo_of_CG06-09_8_20_14_all_40_11]